MTNDLALLDDFDLYLHHNHGNSMTYTFETEDFEIVNKPSEPDDIVVYDTTLNKIENQNE